MTIFALSSGPGISGVAVIRISGASTKDVIKVITKGAHLNQELLPKKIFHEKTKELIDECILIWFPGPNSYTGEDMLEIQAHGSKRL